MTTERLTEWKTFIGQLPDNTVFQDIDTSHNPYYSTGVGSPTNRITKAELVELTAAIKEIDD